MIRIVLLISFLQVSIISLSQNECYTNDFDLFGLTRTHDCDDYTHYIPDINAMELTPEVTIKVNLHFIRKSDGTGIYQPPLEQTFETIFENVNSFYLDLDSPVLPPIQKS